MTIPRLYAEQDLTPGGGALLTPAQSERLLRVLRLQPGARVRLFNGRDGELEGVLAAGKPARLEALTRVRVQTAPGRVGLAFAPLKRTATDWLVEKAVELGACLLQPVMTQRTVAERVRLERLALIAQSAAEQCERLELPRLLKPLRLEQAVAELGREGVLVLFADEAGDDPGALWGGDQGRAAPIAQALQGLAGARLVVLTGPEGGFAPAERAWLRAQPFVRPATLGPRILRAETASLAALSIAQALCGDWRKSLAAEAAAVHMQPNSSGDAP